MYADQYKLMTSFLNHNEVFLSPKEFKMVQDFEFYHPHLFAIRELSESRILRMLAQMETYQTLVDGPYRREFKNGVFRPYPPDYE